MLKKIKIKNSTILLIGIIIITLGICIGFYEYFIERKNKAFSNMNIILYESEQPQNITSNDFNEEEQKPENKAEEDVKENIEVTEPITYNYLGILEIPKINLKNGFYDLNSKYNNVDYNVTIINGSTYPDEQNNNLILAAHSGDCNYCYFDKLYKLQLGDQAYLQYKNVKYSYKIVDIYEVEKDGTVAIYRDYNKNCLTLITCTRGSNTKQTVYVLEQIN
jgi:LPXTG-site transpeptidase (sortase) family protein